MEKKLELARKLNIGAWILTVIILVLVGLMRRIKIILPEGWDFSFLAPFHATVNAVTALVLLAALYFIRKKQVEAHRKAIYVAVGLSILFLLSYVGYHFTTPETLFGDSNHNGLVDAAELAAAGSMRTIYLLLLLSHILLAAISLPFILFTFIRAYTNQFDRHKRLARWVWPVWFYVAVTGPLVYWLLMPYY